MSATNGTQPGRRLNRPAALTLTFVLAFLALDVAQVVYRFFLPTDGWVTTEVALDSPQALYYQNVVGRPSGLRPMDIVTGMAGQPLESFAQGVRPDFWQAGAVVEYTVERAGQELRLPVPIDHWTPSALLTGFITLVPQAVSDLGSFLVLGISLLAFLRRPAEPAAWALLVFAAALSAPSISRLIPLDYSIGFDPYTNILTIFYSYMVYGIVIAPALLAFTLVFPRPKPLVVRHPWVAYAPFGIGVTVAIVLFSGGSVYFGYVLTMLMLLASLAGLAHSALTMRDAVSRAQLRWAIGGLAAGIGLFLLKYPDAFDWLPDQVAYWFAVVSSLGVPVMGIGLAVAVLRYRLFDVDVIIRRTTSYAILTALLAMVYFSAVVLLERFLTPLIGDSTPSVVLSTLLIAALFLPLRRRVQSAIDRRFFRRKYDAEKTLAAFAATVRDETDLDALLAELTRAIQETMQPEHVSVWLRPVDGGRPVANDGP